MQKPMWLVIGNLISWQDVHVRMGTEWTALPQPGIQGSIGLLLVFDDEAKAQAYADETEGAYLKPIIGMWKAEGRG